MMVSPIDFRFCDESYGLLISQALFKLFESCARANDLWRKPSRPQLVVIGLVRAKNSRIEEAAHPALGALGVAYFHTLLLTP